jgi:hypothetical protein
MPNLTTDQQVTLTLIPLSPAGLQVPDSTITGTPLWNSSNINVISLVISPDGFSATASATGAGSATVNVIGNAGTIAAPVQISGSIAFTVSQAGAASFQISASAPINQ